jgi:hypothetical protein
MNLDEYDVISQVDWEAHHWLSRLESGSDLEGDSALVWFTDSEAAERLAEIRLQFRSNHFDWEDALSASGATFPGYGWQQASVGWFRPVWAHLNPERFEGLEWRALIPKNWRPPTE